LAASFNSEALEPPRGPVGGFLSLVGAVMQEAGSAATFYSTLMTGETSPWTDDAYAYDQAVRAASRVLAAFRPPVEATAAGPEDFGVWVADRIMNEVGTGEPVSPKSAQRTEVLRRGLGELVDRAPRVDLASGFQAVEIAPMTAEQKARVEAARRQETDDSK
jgi:hypothetical protein